MSQGLALSDRRGITTTAAAVAIAVIVVVAAGSAYYALDVRGASTSTKEIVFGATLSMTGDLQAFGQEQNWTLSLAVQMINSYGGIKLSNGQTEKVKLVVLNDQSNPTIGETNLQTLVSQYHANVILGELGGVQDSVAQQFASRNAIPYIGPVYVSTAKTCTNCANSWIFAPFENQTNEAHLFLNWFHTEDPSTPSNNVTIAFFGEGDAAAQANNAAGEAYAKQLGYTVCTCSDSTFTPGSTSEMTSFITAAKAAGAAAVYGLPVPPDAVLMIEVAHQLGYAPKAWLLTRGTAVAPFALPALGGVGNLAVGVMSAYPWSPSAPYTGNLLGHAINNTNLVQQYESFWKHPPTLEGVYFTEALVAADAIAAAGSTNNMAIRNALRSGNFSTPMGEVTFTEGGQWVQSQQYIQLLQWQDVTVGGQTLQALQVLEPTNVATTSYAIYPFSWTNHQHQPWPPA
ncbi:MAG: ABC transporter substrate-binding protein [Nitrososphaerota archaeon]|jgi:branched-chain amino acid transport system substrate-binding protein|nr:ABC transporter substrate-binding protein [Nitrososphaerota archaeon]MDG6956180.1 ABC transporter substrate-binding protein [Nitrososphaerota archaeon]MDG6962501.1 ABC transporter substrate-binding protein [Nitrososphaerota archaeon]MDG7008745.1 ABC transporter substrate-binding protein [Nitrososphaerota archaeon]